MGEAKRRGSAAKRSDTKRPRDAIEQAAAVIDEAYRRLAAENIHGPASIPRMAGHLPALQMIYQTLVRDEDLMALGARYPAFQRFAEIMEDDSMRQHPDPALGDLGSPIPESLRLWLHRLLPIAAELERQAPGGDAAGGADAARRRAASFATEVHAFLAAARDAAIAPAALAQLTIILDGYRQRIEAAASGDAAAEEMIPIPIENLADVVAFAERQIGVVEETSALLEPAVRRNRVLDNETVLRVQGAVAMHRNSLFGVRTQVTTWRRGGGLSAEQAAGIEALERRLDHWHTINETLAKLGAAFEGKTIESIMAMSDAELALAVATGKLALPR